MTPFLTRLGAMLDPESLQNQEIPFNDHTHGIGAMKGITLDSERESKNLNLEK